MLNLNKAAQAVLNLTKDQGIEGQEAEIEAVFDGSLSMEDLYRPTSYKREPGKSSMQRAIERVLPVGMVFSTSKSVRVWSFGTTAREIPYKLDESNIDNYSDKYLSANMGGTNYAPVINAIADSYRRRGNYTKEYRSITVDEALPSTSFWGQLFGAKKKMRTEKSFKIDVTSTPPAGPLLVFFYTDGDNDDQPQTIKALQDCAGLPIFWQFIGIKENGSDFYHLKELDEMEGRYIDNANFFEVTLDELNSISDDEIYRRILNEFGRKYIPLAKSEPYRLIA